MLKQTLFIVATAISAPFAVAWSGKTRTSWDCCKPSCAWPESLSTAKARGDVRVCDKYDRPLTFARGRTEQSSCYQPGGGGGYLCGDYQPIPLSNNYAIGFAALGEIWACCNCFNITWTEGPAKGKRMTVQGVSNNPGTGTDITILVPGGGYGTNPQGCTAQYGKTTGRANGGVTSAAECEQLPDNLKGGCYWRFNWAHDDLNNRAVDIQQVDCPSQLREISGCAGQYNSGRV